MPGIAHDRLIDRMALGTPLPERASFIGVVPNAVGQTFTGSAGDDIQNGTADDDTFNFFQGGNDTLRGGSGNDTFVMKAAFTLDDRINGGVGDDTLILNGDYWGDPPQMAPTTIQSIETIKFAAGHDYVLNLNNGNVAAGETMRINASALNGNNIVIIADQVTDGNLVVDCGLGINSVNVNGSADIITGNIGNDFVFFGQNFTPACHFDGVDGNDLLTITGNFTTRMVFQPDTIRNVAELNLTVGLSYNFATDDANVAAGQTLMVQAFPIGNGFVIFDGSAETDGHFEFVSDTPGNDQFTGGRLSDKFTLPGGGDDKVSGSAGDDIINAGDTLTAADRFNGGNGNDTLNLSGDYSGGLPMNPATLVSIENIVFGAGFSYSLMLQDGNVAAGQMLRLDGSALGTGDTLTVRNKGESDGSYAITGGAGADSLFGGKLADTIKGGAGRDIISGGGGADMLNGGTGGDFFTYDAASQSTGVGHDIITGFEANKDGLILPSAVTHMDAPVTHGALSRDTFDANLSTALNADTLGRNHAALFTPDSGKLAGHVFLVVDVNGNAGYQAGLDLVVELVDLSGNISRANFSTTT